MVREMDVLSTDSLPVGFRFRPSDEEILNHYLKRKNSCRSRSLFEFIPEIDICKCEPWDVPEKSLIKSSDSMWYFFCPKVRKYRHGNQSNRASEAGYWKATGKDRMIKSGSDSAVIGAMKILVFYLHRSKLDHPRVPEVEGISNSRGRTNWIMHECHRPEPEQSGFVLCRLFMKPSISDVDGGMGRNSETMQNLSPAPAMLSPDSDTVRASVEPVAPADQNFAVLDLQENVQPFPLVSDMQTSGVCELLRDEASNPSNPEVDLPERVVPEVDDNSLDGFHIDSPLFTDIGYNVAYIAQNVADDHQSNETTEVDVPEYVVPEFDDNSLDGFHIDSPLFTDIWYNVEYIAQNFPPELYRCQPAELDFVTRSFGSLFCHPDEYLHDVSNALGSVRKLDPEEQSFVCSDTSHRDSFSVKEILRGLVEENDATTSDERVKFSGETCKPPFCSSSTEQNNYIDPTNESVNLFSLISDQNLGQDISFVEATTSSSHQVSAEIDDLDTAIIKIRTHKNLSDSDCLMEQQGLATKRLLLQKFAHKKSSPRTDHVSNTTNSDVVISVVNGVRKTLKLQFCEEKQEDTASHDEPASTVIQSCSPKMYDDSKQNILRRRARCGSMDEGLFKYYVLDEVTTPSGSHSACRAILILSASLLLIVIGLTWRISS